MSGSLPIRKLLIANRGEIARRIGGSLCNVTRGARLMRRKDCASAALMGRLERGLEANNG